jgi:cell division protein FtsZ
VTSPLLDNYDISKASKALVNITTNSNIMAVKLQEIFNEIKNCGINGHVFFGHTIDNRLDDKIRITIIATGFQISDFKEETKESRNVQPDFFSQQSSNQSEYIDPSRPAYTYWKPKFLK